MRAQGLLPPEDDAPAIPEGTHRYHIAVEGITTQTGVASPAALAATLRGVADQLDPPRKATRHAH